MAIFLTGDTHGDFTRFKKSIFYEQSEAGRQGRDVPGKPPLLVEGGAAQPQCRMN